MNHRFFLSALCLASLVACGGGDKAPPAETTKAPAPAAAPTTDLTPDPGGKVIPVELVTDDKGNYFSPNKIEAKVGDVVRYTLKIGVHNVHFLPDSNPGKTGLPPASDMLQLPGQTYDLKMAGAFAPGSYYFQCDPHALLGMTGRLTVSK